MFLILGVVSPYRHPGSAGVWITSPAFHCNVSEHLCAFLVYNSTTFHLLQYFLVCSIVFLLNAIKVLVEIGGEFWGSIFSFNYVLYIGDYDNFLICACEITLKEILYLVLKKFEYFLLIFILLGSRLLLIHLTSSLFQVILSNPKDGFLSIAIYGTRPIIWWQEILPQYST